MKILIFNIAKPKEAAALFAYDLACGLKENGIDVYAYLQEHVQNKEEWNSLLEKDHIYYTKLNNDNENHLKQVKYLYCKEKKAVGAFFKGITFDYILTTVFANWSTLIRPIFHYKKSISVCHDPLPHSDEKKLNAFLAKEYYIKSDKLVVLSEKFIQIACKRFKKDPDNVIYMPHGRTSNYKNVKNKIAVVTYNSEFINFLFFGRINKYKGLHVLAKAFSTVERNYSNVSLTVAGNGDFSEFQAEYESLSNVNLLIRYIKDEEVESLFKGPNVVTVVPYVDATQSGIISVAMDYGTPVIASDTGGLREQLDNGKIGFLFKTGDAQDLAEKMEFIINNHLVFDEQRELENAFINSLNWDVVTKQLIERL